MWVRTLRVFKNPYKEGYTLSKSNSRQEVNSVSETSTQSQIQKKKQTRKIFGQLNSTMSMCDYLYQNLLVQLKDYNNGNQHLGEMNLYFSVRGPFYLGVFY